MKKSILIIYTSIGKGHKVMGENIGAALSKAHDVDYIDLIELEQGALIKLSTKFYHWILNSVPWLWEFFYSNRIFLAFALPLRTFVASFKTKKILKVLNSKKYDIVLSTHVNASSIISYLKSKNLLNAKFIISFCDYHLHLFWVFKNADLFIANISEQKNEMLKMGIEPAKILVAGMTLQNKNLPAVEYLRKKYNLQPEDKAVLLTSGTSGYKIDVQLVGKLLKTGVKVFVVCGTNQKAYSQLYKKYAANQSMRLFGYIDFISEIFPIVNVLIGKPGGLTVAEALQNRLPVAIWNAFPGQESQNTIFLRKHQLVLPETENIFDAVKQELSSGEFAKQLQANPYINELVQYGETILAAINGM